MTLRADLTCGMTFAICLSVAGTHPLKAIAAMPAMNVPSEQRRAPDADLHKVQVIMSVRTTRQVVTGNLLLQRSRRAMTYVAQSAIRLSRQGDAQYAPFLRAAAIAARSLQSLDEALSQHDSRSFARAMSGSSVAIGRLNETYRLGGFADSQLHEGLRALNVSWRLFAQSTGRGIGNATAQQRLANGRRIAALRRRLIALRGRRSQSVQEVTQIDYMLSGLDRAFRANRTNGQEWLALSAVNSVYGRFGGYYDYLTVTNPSVASYYNADYAYYQNVDQSFSSSSEDYYRQTSWSSYSQSFETHQNTDLQVSSEESTKIDQETKTTTSEIETEEQHSKECKTLDTTETEATTTNGGGYDDPADRADSETDTQTDKELDPKATPAEESDTSDTHAPDTHKSDEPGAGGTDTKPSEATTDDKGSASPAPDKADEPSDAGAKQDDNPVSGGAAQDDRASDAHDNVDGERGSDEDAHDNNGNNDSENNAEEPGGGDVSGGNANEGPSEGNGDSEGNSGGNGDE